jgi:hypothetical protein
MVPVIVGVALAFLPFVAFLIALANSEASMAREWKLAAVIMGVAFTIGWAGTHLAAKLTTDRHRVVIIGLLLLGATGLYPPWVYTFSPEGAATTTKPAGYHLLFSPPEPERRGPLAGVRIDLLRLAIQWAVLAAFVGIAFVLTHGKVRGNGT